MHADREQHWIERLDASSFPGAIRHGVVLVDFDEPYCGPCQLQLTILKDLSLRIGGDATLIEVNVDEAQELAVRYHVEAIPTLLLFKNGQIRQRFVGLQRESRLAKAIQAAARA